MYLHPTGLDVKGIMVLLSYPRKKQILNQIKYQTLNMPIIFEGVVLIWFGG